MMVGGLENYIWCLKVGKGRRKLVKILKCIQKSTKHSKLFPQFCSESETFTVVISKMSNVSYGNGELFGKD